MGTMLQIRPRTTIAIAGLFLLGASAASAVDVYLRAAPTSVAGAPGAAMWGFASCNASFASCSPVTVPGPRINATAGQPLTIHVKNTLTVPTSVVVPGQSGGGVGGPVRFMGNRARSFSPEAPTSGTTTDYTWSSLKAGTCSPLFTQPRYP